MLVMLKLLQYVADREQVECARTTPFISFDLGR